MKLLTNLLVITFFSFYGYAQEGEINITQDKKIDEVINLYTTSSSSGNVYRIQLGFGSYQRAQRIKEEVAIDFPELYPKVEFKSPSYRVRGGAFKTKLEAERKFSEVRKKYPSAMLLKPKKTSR